EKETLRTSGWNELELREGVQNTPRASYVTVQNYVHCRRCVSRRDVGYRGGRVVVLQSPRDSTGRHRKGRDPPCRRMASAQNIRAALVQSSRRSEDANC